MTWLPGGTSPFWSAQVGAINTRANKNAKVSDMRIMIGFVALVSGFFVAIAVVPGRLRGRRFGVDKPRPMQASAGHGGEVDA